MLRSKIMRSVARFFKFHAHAQMMVAMESGEEATLVGGQAVMEGVMMRAPHSYCVAVRRANGDMEFEEREIPKISEKYKFFKYPILRGLGTLGQAMKLGFQSLQFSMNTALKDEAEREAAEKAAAGTEVSASGEAAASGEEPKSTELGGMALAVQALLSVGFFIVMYKFVPLFLAERIAEGRLAINLWDGVIRLAIFLTFLFALSQLKDIRRVFEYHGAEHKVVFNFESGKPLTVENAQKFTTFHPRCGTSFLLVLMIISMITYEFLPIDNFWWKFAARIALLPFIVGASYELIRFAAKRQGKLLGFLTAPGLWLQRVTTKPPDDTQAEVAIEALNGAMKLEEKQGGELVIA